MTQAAESLATHLKQELGKHIVGMEDVIHALTIAAIARGHILLEGPPGLGKTSLGRAFASVLGGSFKRIQGTADLMPSDITGVHVYNTQQQKFEFQAGPLFADVVLVDEINRAGPKTQSALLEAMEERQVSVDRDSFSLPEDFLVIATMNPGEFEGTFPLPESQLDRFSLSVPMSYLSAEQELEVLSTYNLPTESSANVEAITPLSESALAVVRDSLKEVHIADDLLGYVRDIAAASRDSNSISLGLSVRGALTLARAARIEAALRGGDFVIPDDVKRVAPWIIPHRLMLTPEAIIDGTSANACLERLLDQVAVPK